MHACVQLGTASAGHEGRSASQHTISSSNMGARSTSHHNVYRDGYQLSEMTERPAAIPDGTRHAAMPHEKAAERPMGLHGGPVIHERPAAIYKGPAVFDGRPAAVHTYGESPVAMQGKVQASVIFRQDETVQTPPVKGRNQVKHKHTSREQAAAMHFNMLKQAGGGKVASPAEGSPTVSSAGKEAWRMGEVWSRKQWERVRRRLEEAGEVAMTLVYKDGSSQLRSAQVMDDSCMCQWLDTCQWELNNNCTEFAQ